MDTIHRKHPRHRAVGCFTGFLPIWLFSLFTTWNILSPGHIRRFPGWLNAMDQAVFTSSLPCLPGKAYADFALLFDSLSTSQSDNLKRGAGTSVIVFLMAAGAAGRVRKP